MTKNERLDYSTCFGLDKHYTWDICCDICGSIIFAKADFHGNSHIGKSQSHSVRVSKYTDERIDVCTKHSDASIEKFIKKLKRGY